MNRSAPPTEALPGLRRDTAVPWLLRALVVAVFVFPADMVVGPIGAVGHVGMLVALVLAVLWIAAGVLGLHDPIPYRNPVRLALGVLWLVTVVCYVTMPPAEMTAVSRASADRWVLMLLGISGALLTTTDTVRSLRDALRLVGALTAGATICALVALCQFVAHVDPMDWVRGLMVGMSENGGTTAFQARGAFLRVAGSTFHPIELGVVSCMVLPLAVWRALQGGTRHRWLPWVQVVLVAAAALLTVSRSAILALAVVALVLVPFLPPVAKKWSVVAIPAGVAGVFLVIPGFVSTVTALFTAGSSDTSLTTRTDNYPRVVALFSDHPLTGRGPGTYIVGNALEIVDNQYLHTAIEMGLLGVLALLAFLLLPALAALQAARHAVDQPSRTFAGAVAASASVAVVGSGTFDSLSFPVFTIVLSVVVGLAGASWMIVRAQVAPTLPARTPNPRST